MHRPNIQWFYTRIRTHGLHTFGSNSEVPDCMHVPHTSRIHSDRILKFLIACMYHTLQNACMHPYTFNSYEHNTHAPIHSCIHTCVHTCIHTYMQTSCFPSPRALVFPTIAERTATKHCFWLRRRQNRYTFLHAYAWTHLNGLLWLACVWFCMHTCTYIHAHVCIYTYKNYLSFDWNIRAYVPKHVNVFVSMCMHAYTCMYGHTHTHMHTQTKHKQ